MEYKKKRQLEVYHRAFKALRSETLPHESSQKNRAAIRKNNAQADKLETVRYECSIETDWIERIEASLPSLEAAVLEDRQFIRQEGSTVPIEKAKHVSRASVEHLAKHSNLITHVPEEGDKLIPDKLYVVENLSNYAIYENRFLYMLLNYIKDFVTIRHEAIEALWNSYESEFAMSKDVHLRRRHMVFSIHLTETSHNAEDTAYNREILDLLGRMNSILHMVSILLNTPLMQEVSKAPMLKPPITRTNMLRMDTHFRAAMDLFDYLTAYLKKGYEVKKIRHALSPLPDEAGDEFAELALLCSYLIYAYGAELKGDLEAEYTAEEERRLEAADEARYAELQVLRQRIRESGGDPESYMLLLEKRNDELEGYRQELKKLRVKHKELQESHDTLKAELEQATTRLVSVQQSLNDVSGQLTETERAREEAKEGYENTLSILNATLSQLQEELNGQADGDGMAQTVMPESPEENPDDGVFDVGDILSVNDDGMVSFDLPNEEERSDSEYKKMYFSMKALYNGLRKQTGRMPLNEDYSSPEGIQELENELSYFMAFFDEEWKKAKKNIRRKYLWTKKIRKAAAEEKYEPSHAAETNGSVTSAEPTSPAEPVESAESDNPS